MAGSAPCSAEARPDLVLVHGDTTTTFAAALAAFYARTGCGHVEAGLRTHDRWSPYPEEMNRRLAGQLCTLHFAPTARNAENLRREGVEGGVFVTGNTVIDALGYTAHGEGFESPELRALDLTGRRVVTLTCHRRENYGEPMARIFAAVREIALAYPGVLFVYPVHLSPTVRQAAARRPGRRGEYRAHRAALRRGHAPSDRQELHGHDRLRRHTGGGPRAGQARARAAQRDRAPRGRGGRDGRDRRDGDGRISSPSRGSCCDDTRQSTSAWRTP